VPLLRPPVAAGAVPVPAPAGVGQPRRARGPPPRRLRVTRRRARGQPVRRARRPLYLRDVRDTQARARGVAYEKKRPRRHPKQAKLHQEHHQSPAAAVVPVTSLATESRGGVVEPVAPHFLFPHAHLFHGNLFAPGTEEGVGGVTGEDMAMAMAEAHAAGCVMPLSVFH
jgi:hypothetical protein